MSALGHEQTMRPLMWFNGMMQSPSDEQQMETATDLAAVEALALEVFLTPEEAESWFDRVHPTLRISPNLAARTGDGANRVRMILNAIKYGGPV